MFYSADVFGFDIQVMNKVPVNGAMFGLMIKDLQSTLFELLVIAYRK